MTTDHTDFMDDPSTNGVPVHLVSGASGGIGSAVCRQLSASSATLALASRPSERLEELGRELHAPVWELDIRRYTCAWFLRFPNSAYSTQGTAYIDVSIDHDANRTAATNEVVRALDRRTEAKLWQASWKGSMRVPFFAMSNGSWIRATPAYDGESLFVTGMRDVLVSLNAASGEVQWRMEFLILARCAVCCFSNRQRFRGGIVACTRAFERHQSRVRENRPHRSRNKTPRAAKTLH
jgi:NAD(P)-dependent dehydrogenase (short-subunit alcohol dehydrogenase family)